MGAVRIGNRRRRSDDVALVSRGRRLRPARLDWRKAARLQGLIQTAPDGLLIADSGGRLTFANDQAAQLFGYRPEGLKGKAVGIAFSRSRFGPGLGAMACENMPKTRAAPASSSAAGIAIITPGLGRGQLANRPPQKPPRRCLRSARPQRSRKSRGGSSPPGQRVGFLHRSSAETNPHPAIDPQ